MGGGRTGGGLRTTAAVSAALTTAVLPVFLIGATSDAIREDLGVSETAIGGAVTVLFVSVGLSAGPVGRLTERLGASRALRAGVLLSAVATAVAGGLARSWWQLAAPLLLVGVAIGLIDTGGARAFADRITAGRQGLAFGLKEASVPAASLLAGVALPTLAAAYGWRAAFLAAPVLAALVLLILPRRAGDVAAGPTATGTTGSASHAAATAPSASPPAPAAPPEVRAALLRFAVGVALGAGAATAAATFLVPAATSRGLSTNAAGTLLVVASVASIAGRIGLGRWADREAADPTRAVTVMLAAGGLGAAALALTMPGPLVVVAAIVVLGAGWGWTGLAFLAAVRARPAAPAVAAGTVLTGLGIGGALGPLAFGGLASTWSYRAAWTAAAAAMLVASGLAASASASTTRTPAGQVPPG